MRIAVLLALSALAGFAQTPRPVYAITHVKAVVSPSHSIDSATIVVRDGLIESIGSNVPVPADARVFDGGGATIYPGLIDAATFYGFPAPLRASAAPSTPGGPAAAATGTEDDINAPWRYLRPQPTGLHADVSAATKLTIPAEPDPRRNQGFTTVLAIPRDGQVHGTSALMNLGDGPAAESVVVSPVAMHVSFATGGFASRGYPTSMMGVFAVLRQSFIRAQEYRNAKKLYEAGGRRGMPRPAADPDSEALLPVLDGTLPVVFEADLAEDIRRVLRFSREFKLKPVILGGAEAWKVSDLLKQRDVPVLVRLSLEPARGETGFSRAPMPFEAPANSPDRIAAESNPGKLEKAGVKFAFVTAGWEKVDQIRSKIRTAMTRGLSREGALGALTFAPAEIAGAGNQLGTIEPGKVANLVLADVDLFDAKSRVKASWIDGKLYYPSAERKTSGARSSSMQTASARPAAPPPGTASNAPADRAAAHQNPPASDDPTEGPQLGGTNTTASPIPERRPPLPDPAPRDLVIRNATLLTITKGTIDKGDIWIHEGKIRQVGGSVAAVDGAKVLDGTGRFVMPGIIDSHSHTAIRGGINEMGPSVTAQCRIADVLNPDDVDIYREAAGGVTTLNVLHGSANAIGGENATIKTKWGSPVDQLLFPGAPRGLKMALGENPKRSNFSPGARFPATRMGVERVIRESFKAAREYDRAWEEYRTAAARGEKKIPPERNLALDTLAGVLRGEVYVHAHCYRADEISMLLDIADEFGFKIRSLQHVLEGYKVADKIRKHGAGASTFADFWGYKMEAFDGTPYNAAMLVRAGVRTAINSDSDERARRLYQEAAKTMKYGGLTEIEALRLITTEPAWILGVEKRVGALEPGMDGDLAVFNAHPFSPYARVEMTVIDGQVVFDRQRDLERRIPWKKEFQPETDPVIGETEDEQR